MTLHACHENVRRLQVITVLVNNAGAALGGQSPLDGAQTEGLASVNRAVKVSAGGGATMSIVTDVVA